MKRNGEFFARALAAASLSVALALAMFASGCYSNPHGYQDTPPIRRLVSVPSGATVEIPKLNLRLETPCDLPTELGPSDEISVSKPGYVPFRGRLGELREISRWTYEARLNPANPNP